MKFKYFIVDDPDYISALIRKHENGSTYIFQDREGKGYFWYDYNNTNPLKSITLTEYLHIKNVSKSEYTSKIQDIIKKEFYEEVLNDN